MFECHGPKCQEMHFPASSFQKTFRTHNRLLCKKLRLLKTLKKTLPTHIPFDRHGGFYLSVGQTSKNLLQYNRFFESGRFSFPRIGHSSAVKIHVHTRFALQHCWANKSGRQIIPCKLAIRQSKICQVSLSGVNGVR